VHRAHWFDGNSRFYDAVSANHSKMDLSIRGHRFSKDGSPINVPSGEDSVCITCDGEQKRLPTHTRQARAIVDIRQWSVFGETHRGIPADFETAAGLQSSRVAFCFCFRHSWKTVGQIS
jgi:hypothetical protein